MDLIAETLALALQHLRARELPQAERLLRQIVRDSASHVEAWRELGLTCLEMGKLADAEESFRQAIRLAPENAATHSDLGISLAQQKKLTEAEQSFREALRLQPGLAAGYNNLGLTLMGQKRLDEAITAIRRAIKLAPTFADAHNNLGLVLSARGQVLDAVDCYRQALRFDPNHVNAQNNLNRALGQTVHRPPPPTLVSPPPSRNKEAAAYNDQAVQFFREGRFQDAITAFQRALRIQPDYADVHNNLGNIFVYQGRYEEAFESFRRALALDPTDGIFHSNLGNALSHQEKFKEAEASCREAVRLAPREAGSHSNLADALKGLGKLGEAAASYHEALRIQPNSPKALYGLGLLLAERNKLPEAIERYREAVRLKPDYVEALVSLAKALVDDEREEKIDEGMAAAQRALRFDPNCMTAQWALGCAYTAKQRFQEAIHCFEEVSRLKPDYSDAHWARGVALLNENRCKESLAAFDEALRINPDHPRAHLDRSLTNLVLGNLESGFCEYEWRTKCKDDASRPVSGPVWDGSPLGGRTILLRAEQGLGDTLQFVRYAAPVKRTGGTVIVECQAALVQLLQPTPGIDQIIGQGSPLPACDVQASLVSLPAIMGTTPATLPAEVPYVFPDEGLVEQWRREVSALPGFRIGISWQGNREHQQDRFRSIPVREFEPLARLEGVQLISLQKGYGVEQLRGLAGRFTVLDWTSRLDDATGPFMDTAALMKNLDLFVTSDTSTAHLAGALGVPVWVVVPFVPDWRWQLDREDSPWYPTMRLFRPCGRAKWGEVFQRVARELQKLLGAGQPRSQPSSSAGGAIGSKRFFIQ